ncbi:MAG TPA: hypothetical protein VI756_19380 [Blastocatellia bacterium]
MLGGFGENIGQGFEELVRRIRLGQKRVRRQGVEIAPEAEDALSPDLPAQEFQAELDLMYASPSQKETPIRELCSPMDI